MLSNRSRAVPVSYTHLDVYKRQINNCSKNWWVAIVAIIIIVACNIWGKGMIKIIPILLGVVGSYVLAVIVDPAVRENVVKNVSEAKWVALPIHCLLYTSADPRR